MIGKGKFIVIEGLDGSGKTTQTKILTEKLQKKGITVVNQAEPTSHEFGKMCREVLSGRKKIRKSQHKLPSIHCQLSFRKKKTTSACYHLPSPTPPTPQMAIVLGVPPTNFLLLAKLLFLTQAQALLLWAFVQLLAVSSK